MPKKFHYKNNTNDFEQIPANLIKYIPETTLFYQSITFL